MMKKPTPEGGTGVSCGKLLTTAFAKKYPTLCEWLATDTWEDGTVRATTTLFLFVDRGWLKCMMKDRDAGMVAFCTEESLDGLLASLERGLRDGSTEWKPDRPPAGRGRK